MTPAETTTILRQFNEWRRGADVPQPKPREIGEAIDAAIAMIDRLEAAESDALEQARLSGMGASREASLMSKLEAAEKERDSLRADKATLQWMTYSLKDRLEVAEKSDAESIAMYRKARDERDNLRAKVEQMEKQEPVAWAATDETKTVVEALGMNQSRRFDSPLFLATGAQPRLNEIKITLQRALELGKRQTWTGARKHRSWEEQREEHQCWNKVWSLLGAQGEEK